ncbi:hypothetical protein FOL47_009534 [Perkinsus chesapeaki]|uniref:Uncharacterized protein n=1 Tax=Perkinsus chesapeaki TaxID=330153 RepID=A0A7J6L7P7_PERCH|nr:hypothetical protein FOL47_009534 [Perkinsus chesapeaki]
MSDVRVLVVWETAEKILFGWMRPEAPAAESRICSSSPPASVLKARQLMSKLDELIGDTTNCSSGDILDKVLELERSAIHHLVGIANILETHRSLTEVPTVCANLDIIGNIYTRITSTRSENLGLFESAREATETSDAESESCQLRDFVPPPRTDDSSPKSFSSNSSEGEIGWSDEEAAALEKFEAAISEQQVNGDRARTHE